ncbi:MAG: hypothetical protein WDM90_22185 [Ferruginibacter sp.]
MKRLFVLAANHNKDKRKWKRYFFHQDKVEKIIPNINRYRSNINFP